MSKKCGKRRRDKENEFFVYNNKRIYYNEFIDLLESKNLFDRKNNHTSRTFNHVVKKRREQEELSKYHEFYGMSEYAVKMSKPETIETFAQSGLDELSVHERFVDTIYTQGDLIHTKQ